jgi:hypothetical protein
MRVVDRVAVQQVVQMQEVDRAAVQQVAHMQVKAAGDGRA